MKKSLLILWVCALAYFFIFSGIDWGVPSAGRIALVMDEQIGKVATSGRGRKYTDLCDRENIRQPGY
ncbi:MAG: hypothetical protein AAB359_09715 [Elusimicrobiota bacterium]